MTFDLNNPGSFTVQNTKERAKQLIDASDYHTAADILEGVRKLAPRDPDLILMLGMAQHRNSRNDQAIRHLKYALDLRPNHMPTLATLCDCYQSVGEIGKAHKLADRMLDLEPNGDSGIMLKARLFQTRGRVEDALGLIRNAMAAGNPSPRLAAMMGVLCQHTGAYEEGIAALSGTLDDVTLASETRRDLLFTIGALYDGAKDYDNAFEHVKRGNDMLDEMEPETYEKYKEIWTGEFVENLRGSGSDSDLALFVLGMPRSGTTLTEQILLAHPAVETVGESTAMKEAVRTLSRAGFAPEALAKLAKQYLRIVSPAAGPDSQRILDKMPGNYAFLGAIAAGLPNSTIVHCMRDARDTVVSCFFQNFGPRLPYTRRLRTCAEQYVCYRKLMDHWREELDITIYDSVYEDLVAEPEPKSRALIAHTGLPWDDACLEYHKKKTTVTTASIAQVRKPIYKSSRERWRRYEKHLGEALEILEGY